MTRQQVELDPKTRFALTIDEKRARREAGDLLHYLSAPGALLPEDVRERVKEVVEASLDGRQSLPMDVNSKPLNLAHLQDIGLNLPAEFLELYSRFFNTATGSRIDVAGGVEKRDGKLFGWMEFED